MTIASTTSTAPHYDAAMVPAVAGGAGGDKRAMLSKEHWLRELQALLRVHEPAKVQYASELLAAYEGLERELVQCYRHYYTGEGGFRVSSDSSDDVTFSLPREAIDTFLQVKLRARRSHSFASKGDGVRDVELAAVTQPTSATRVPRQRATSASAVRMY